IVSGPAEDRSRRWRPVGRRQIGGERAACHQYQQTGRGEHRTFVRSHVESPDVKLVREIQIRARGAIRNLIIKQASDVIVGECGTTATGKLVYQLLTICPQATVS